MKFNRNEMKEYMMFTIPSYTLLHNKDKHIKLILEADLFNNHLNFSICDENEEFFYDTVFNISEAIDLFYDKIEE